MKFPSLVKVVSFVVGNWKYIKPIAEYAWDIIASKEDANIPSEEKEAKAIESLQTKFPYLATSIAKGVLNIFLLLFRSFTRPATLKTQLEQAPKLALELKKNE